MPVTGGTTTRGIPKFSDADSPDLGAGGLGSILDTLDALVGAYKLATLTAPLGGAGTFDFSNIAQTFSDLLIKFTLRSDFAAASANAFVRFNGDSALNYDHQQLVGSAAAAGASETFAASGAVFAFIPANTAGGSLFGSGVIWIPNYASAAANKTTVSSYGLKTGVASGNMGAGHFAGFWRSNAAINRVTIVSSGNLSQSSTATLIGLP